VTMIRFSPFSYYKMVERYAIIFSGMVPLAGPKMVLQDYFQGKHYNL